MGEVTLLSASGLASAVAGGRIPASDAVEAEMAAAPGAEGLLLAAGRRVESALGYSLSGCQGAPARRDVHCAGWRRQRGLASPIGE